MVLRFFAVFTANDPRRSTKQLSAAHRLDHRVISTRRASLRRIWRELSVMARLARGTIQVRTASFDMLLSDTVR